MTDLIKAADALAEMVSGALPQLMTPDEFLCCPGRDCSCLGATVHQFAEHTIQSALTAYRQAREGADGVKVKPLDMPERRNGYWGDKDGYQVAHTRDDLFRVRFHGKVICRDIRGFDRAVEWANKHNEARIKAALED